VLTVGATLAGGTGAALASHDDPAHPDDPLWENQWGPQQIRVEPAWDRTAGGGTVTAIVDSGIDLDHPDLSSKVTPGNTFLECGASGCGNGDWQSGPGGTTPGEPHGTHVAGIAGAATANGTGIGSVAPDTTLLAIRVLDETGTGTFEDIALGVRYAADNGADVINLSLGAPTLLGESSEANEAIQYALSKGVTVVAAAGNSFVVPLCEEPAFQPEVVCVGATSSHEVKASYSNLPNNPDTMGVSAPGGELSTIAVCYEGIVSTMPPGEGQTDCDYPSEADYGENVGTSMAAPHVAGVAALLVAQGCSREQIHELLQETSRQGGTETRGEYTPVYGWGIVDADAATAAAVEKCAGGQTSGTGPTQAGTGAASVRRSCAFERSRATSRRVGLARIGSPFVDFDSRHLDVQRQGRVVQYCVGAGRGRFFVGSNRRGRIDFVASTAAGHGSKRLRPERSLARARVAGVRRLRGSVAGVFIGNQTRGGRFIYGVQDGRVTFVGTVSRRQAAQPHGVAARLGRLGLAPPR